MPGIDYTRIVTAGERRAEVLAGRLAALAARREAAVAAGVTAAGVSVASDDAGQSRITAAALAALEDPGLELVWKAREGFVRLDAAAVRLIAAAVRAHVQACFDHEAVLAERLAAAADPAAVDIDAGWPGPAAGAGRQRDAARAAR